MCFWGYGGCYYVFFISGHRFGRFGTGPSAWPTGATGLCVPGRRPPPVPPGDLWRAQDHPQKRAVSRSTRPQHDPRPPLRSPDHAESTYAVHPCPKAGADAPRRGVLFEIKHSLISFRSQGPPWLSPGLRTRLRTSVCTRMWISRSDRPEARTRVRVATGPAGPI